MTESTDESETRTEQGALLTTQDVIQSADYPLYLVITTYDDDPHPHLEGVFSSRPDAQELMDRCRAVTETPNPIAWAIEEVSESDVK
jgi:hypothetical protein